MWFRILVVFWAVGPLQSALAGNYSKNLGNFEKKVKQKTDFVHLNI